jgi:truncated hemoglobin YjbI
MSSQKYKNIGKKEIINVVSQMIQKVEAIEITLDLFIKMIDKEKKFNDFMTEQLGGANEVSRDAEASKDGDTTQSTSD